VNANQRLIEFVALCAVGFAVDSSGAQIRPLNNDTPAFIEVGRTEVAGFEGSSVTIHLFRTGEFRWTTRVDYLLVGGSAEEGSDFTAAGGTLVFQPGEGMKAVEVQLAGDEVSDTGETLHLKLSANDVQTVVVQGTVTIRIDDPPGVISGPPRLRMASTDDGHVVLSWDGFSEALLEHTVDPIVGRWEKVPCTVEHDGETSRVTERRTAQPRFYRLRLP
jgi:hypothetical protein